MKKLFLILAVAVFAVSTAMAQAVHTPTMGKTGIRLYNHPAHRAARGKDLHCTDEG